MNKYEQSFNGEICILVDITHMHDQPYGVYTFVGNTLAGAFYFETEEEAQEKYQKIMKNLKEEQS